MTSIPFAFRNLPRIVIGENCGLSRPHVLLCTLRALDPYFRIQISKSIGYKKNVMGMVIVALALLSGCSPRIDSHGYNVETINAAQVNVGIDTQKTIQERLGSPSTVSVFPVTQQGSSWYYISKKTSATSFYHPETLEQHVLVIDFDAQGIVQNVRRFEGEHQIEAVNRKTETSGYESSLLRDIFGNFGRYSGASSKPRQ